ncbi:MAG: hypothetical protein AAFW47_08875 [Pseudomonadota bacterium]
MVGFSAAKTSFALALLVACAIILAGCGRKPSLRNLKPAGAPAQAQEQAQKQAGQLDPAATESIDGKRDGLEQFERERPKRPFLLDFLL